MLRSMIAGLVAAFSLTAVFVARPALATTVSLRDVAAQVTVIPEDRADIAVTMIKTNPRLPIHIHPAYGGVTVVDGDLPRNWWRRLFGGSIASCPGEDDQSTVRVWGAGTFTMDELPRIVIRAPRQARVRSRGAILGVVGRSDSLNLSVAGCDRWTIANVRGDLTVNYAGAGEVHAGSAGHAKLSIAGANSMTLGRITGGLDVDIAGAGDIKAAEVSGPVDLDIVGDGHVRMNGGRASAIRINIAGSGDVDYRGVAGGLAVSIAGSGNVAVAKVTGPVTKSIAGAGRVTIGP